MNQNNEFYLFAGSSHTKLANEICEELACSLGRASLSLFPDGELAVEIQEDVGGKTVFLLQTIAINPNQYLMEMLVMIDALKRASAKKIIAITPYLGYCRQDRKNKPGEPITAKLVANILSIAGVDHLITFDLHADQVEGFFEIPVDHLHCQELLSREAMKLLGENTVILAPDVGSLKIAEKMSKYLGIEIAFMKKERKNPFEVSVSLIGDVKGKNVLIADDMCSTGGTLVAAANLCRTLQAERIIGMVTHGLFVGSALEKITSSSLEAMFTTNTIPDLGRYAALTKIKTLSVASMIAQAICRLTH